jgi:hypothetical protein
VLDTFVFSYKQGASVNISIIGLAGGVEYVVQHILSRHRTDTGHEEVRYIVHACIYICTCMYKLASQRYVCMCVWVFIYMYAHAWVYACVFVCVCVCVCVRVRVRVCVCVCIYYGMSSCINI